MQKILIMTKLFLILSILSYNLTAYADAYTEDNTKNIGQCDSCHQDAQQGKYKKNKRHISLQM